MTYFTSDLHFWHANIIKYCSRPFRDVKHMNRELITRWNARVTPSDTIYVLGDFAMCDTRLKTEILRVLNGHKILVRGNHDKSAKKMLECGFDEVYETLLLDLPEGKFRLSHVPPGWHDERRQKLNKMAPNPYEVGITAFLCGHVHTNWARSGSAIDIINVGVDVRDYEPKTLAELMEIS